jgi:hypothetical protein
LFPKFANGGKLTPNVVDTVGNFPLVLLETVANLPTVSMTLAVRVAKFPGSVVDTSGAP